MLQPTCPRCEATYDPPRDTCATCAPGGRPIHLVDDAALRATPAPARYLLGLVLEGRFRIDGYLGGGGMSSVYRATQLSVDRSVALKIIRADLMSDAAAEARFEQEAKVVAQLAHPFVVQVYDFGRATLDEGGAPVFYIAMEQVDGRSLAAQVADGPLPLERAAAIGRDVLRGLEFAHGRGVV
ncbi:MAG: protein kinase, partial [Myxococcales bacterium]|nr:protein kinase [Myxococcales bacterium]